MSQEDFEEESTNATEVFDAPFDEYDDDAEYPVSNNDENASLKLVNLLYNTPEDKLLDLCVLPKSQPTKIGRMLAMNKLFDPDRHTYEWWINPDTGNRERRVKKYVTLDALATNFYLHATRSVNGKLMDIGSVHVEAQILEDEEEIYDEYREQ